MAASRSWNPCPVITSPNAAGIPMPAPLSNDDDVPVRWWYERITNIPVEQHVFLFHGNPKPLTAVG
ncbi:MAG: hypothetical protein P4L86_24070 [Mycobacterium sp.]|nr:hypothetical protein [Mycobacterium sp.]